MRNVYWKRKDLIEIIPKLFVSTQSDIEYDKIQGIYSFDGTMPMIPNACWIPTIIQGKVRKQQINLAAMAIWSELSNNKNIVVLGNTRETLIVLAFCLSIIKNISILEAKKFLEEKTSNLQVDLSLFENSILEEIFPPEKVQ